jgi:hypothetical protein
MKRGMPVLIYLMAEDHPVPLKDMEHDPEKMAKLEALKKELGANHVAGFFRFAGDVGCSDLSVANRA